MQALIQRVVQASVSIDGLVYSSIGRGLLVFLGVEQGDDQACVNRLSAKVLGYRVFADEQQKMNLSVVDCAAELLIVSQFTLAADTRKGLRPSFSSAAAPEQAQRQYEAFVSQLQRSQLRVKTGQFGADMQVNLINDGPVTFLLRS